ncbi:kinetochore CENP-C fungal-like protein [Rhypophila decipiens]|uniref:CENP-C homolog n=1 Tax=Rhypophila decipiens TaxID=261697 RepID=A0AAN6YAD4_9PEZI|nr:kinetochore CENP-C fungal-like protein [Rhypophila decipiens]
MVSRPSQQRRTLGPQSEQFHELGVAGRKTGITLKDTGIRDEHGMEPIDALFSSPRKEGSEQDELEEDGSGDDGSGEDMDITTTSGIGPAALLNGHTTRLTMPLPQSRSPVKTSLNSPAQRNRLLARSSSPLHGSGMRPSHSSSQPARTTKAHMDFNRLQAGAKALSQPTKASRRVYEEEESEEDEVDAFVEESLEMLGGGDDDDMVDLPAADYDSPVEEEEQVQATAAAKKKPGRKPKPKESPQAAKPGRKPARRVEPEPEPEDEEAQPEEDEPEEDEEPEAPPPKPQQRGWPPKNTAGPSKQLAGGALSSMGAAQSKKRRTPDDAVEPEETSQPKSKKPRSASPAATAPRGRGRPKANTAPAETAPSAASKKATPPAAAPEKPKRGRKRKSSIDPNQVIIPRGPPLPKSRGLMINSKRNENPSTMKQTRSGRTSYKPLAFWRNEHAEFEMEEAVDDFAAPGAKTNKKFLLPSIKEVVRVDEPEVEHASGRKKKGKKGAGRPGYHDSDDVIADAWEKNPGAIEGEVQVWYPEHEKNPPGPDEEVEYIDRQLAISGRAIKTSKVKNATFKFAKTVSEGFFGAGVVDMPPGSVKTQKNSRKMFMTFFVFSGRVSVTVGDNVFRISKGGMWFVPRGNYYSIENDYDQPARIFFAQGCEVNAVTGEGMMGEQSVMMSVEADQSQAE